MKQDIDELKKSQTEQKNRILDWKKYYERQKIIIVVTDKTLAEESLLKTICQIVKVKYDYVAFAVLAPLTFLHLHDFKNNLKNATTRFCFTKNGQVVTEDNTGLGIINYERAFSEIVKRVTGANINEIIPEVPATNLFAEGEELKLAERLDNFNKNLNLWMEKFKKLPAVEAVELYDMDSPGRLATINVKTNFPKDDCIDFYTLEIGNKVEHPSWDSEGEPSKIYEEWCNADKCTTYEEFYNALVELSNLYVNMPEA